MTITPTIIPSKTVLASAFDTNEAKAIESLMAFLREQVVVTKTVDGSHFVASLVHAGGFDNSALLMRHARASRPPEAA